jgi:tetratricopeptide (TPR) repeat protein
MSHGYARVGALLLVATLWGCGGATKTKTGPTAAAVPKEALADFARGVEASNAGAEPDVAVAHYERAVSRDPEMWEARFNLGLVLAERGELARAEKELAAAAGRAPDAEDVVVAWSEVCRRQGDAESAISALQPFTTRHPEALTARASLVSALREAGKTDAAIAEARAVLVRRPGDATTLSELALAHLDRGEVDAAELLVQQALASEQKTAAAERTAGLVALRRGEDALAFRHFERAAELNPRDSTALLNIGTVLLQAGVYDRAEKAFRAVLDNDSSDVDAKLGLAAALRGRGSRDAQAPFAEAEKLLLEVLKAQPKNAAASLNLGILYLRNLDRKADARKMFLQAKDDSADTEDAHARAELLLKEVQ